MKVFAVSSGCYSDYSIHGVFSTEELAQAYCNEYNSTYNYPASDLAGIEEWQVDALKNEKCQILYMAVLNTLDGSVRNQTSNKQMRVEDYTHNASDRYSSIGQSTISAEHAMKLAVEARQAWLRENPPKIGKKNAKKEK